MAPFSPAEQFLAKLVEHQRRLAGYVRAILPHRADADDVLQEINIYLWRNMTEFQPGTNFSAFHQAWTDLAHVLFNCKLFIFIE